MNVPEAVAKVLAGKTDGMTIHDITDEILKRKLYAFNTDKPENIVGRAIRRHCVGVEKSYSCPEKFFSCVKTNGEKDKYRLCVPESEIGIVLREFSYPKTQVQSINNAQQSTSSRTLKMDAQNQTIRKLLEQYCFRIPDYQRSYSWKNEQITEFMEDLYNIVHGDYSEVFHFLGAMTMAMVPGQKNAMDLIDGQQRVTTIFILLYVILEEYKSERFKKKASNRANELYRRLAYLNDDGELVGSRLVLGKFNAEFFKEFIVEGHAFSEDEKTALIKKYTAKREYTQNQAIAEAYYQIKLSIEERLDCCNSDDDAYEYLKALHVAIYDHFEAVTMIVEDEADAFLIFETLNDRGLALSAVDLIKNKLFQIFAGYPSEFEALKDDWEYICHHIDKKDDLKKFILHYWRARIEYTTSQSLFKTCRDHLQMIDFQGAKAILKDLKEDCIYYNGFCNPNGNYPWNNAEVKELLNTMNELRYDLVRPLLLAGWHKYQGDEEKFAVVVRLCLNFMIRYISVLDRKPTTIDKSISRWARDTNFSIEFLKEKMEKEASDADFKDKLETLSLPYTQPLTHYLLRVYEAEGCGRKEVWTSAGRKTNTVEHVLPQTVTKGKDSGDFWIAQFGNEEACGLYSSKMGNYAFLTSKAQSKASNKDFAFKKSVYATETDMKLTQELCEYSEWTIKSIEKRQKRMTQVWVKYISFHVDENADG